jgi:pseudouridylate synthase
LTFKLTFTADVRAALDKGSAVVALESTIIAHGMPYPQNVETAREVEKIVRDGGAVPATIAILGGEVKIGLSPDELDYLGREGRNIRKVSVRDLPYRGRAQARWRNDGRLHDAAGGDGGHSGVRDRRHRRCPSRCGEDIRYLCRHDRVCKQQRGRGDGRRQGDPRSGALTLETLETLGVPVVGFGTDEFPPSIPAAAATPFRCAATPPGGAADAGKVGDGSEGRRRCGESHSRTLRSRQMKLHP